MLSFHTMRLWLLAALVMVPLSSWAAAEILYEEHFDGPSPAIEIRSGRWNVREGRLVAETTTPATRVVTLAGLAVGDFDLRVVIGHVRPATGAIAGGVGIWFRADAAARPETDGYTFLVRTDETYARGETALMAPGRLGWEHSTEFHNAGLSGNFEAPFVLRLVATGGGLEAWINGRYLQAHPIPGYERGTVGLITVNAGASFDDIEVLSSARRPTLLYLAQGPVRCGFFLPWGGVCVDFRVDRNGNGLFWDESNLIDLFGAGRCLGTAFWEVNLPGPCGTSFGRPYNPTQGGHGWPQHVEPGVESYTYDTTDHRWLSLRTRPVTFNLCGIPREQVTPDDLEIEQVAELGEDGVLRLLHRVTHVGTVYREWREHEIPLLFAPWWLENGYTYRGNDPWTAAPLFRLGPGFFHEGMPVLEPYYIYADAEGFGLGMGAIPLHPHPARVFPALHVEPRHAGPFFSHGEGFHYCSFTPHFPLVPGQTVAHQSFFAAGRVDDIRRTMYALIPHPRWEFALGHEGWTTTSGRPASHDAQAGTLVVQLDPSAPWVDSQQGIHCMASTHSAVEIRVRPDAQVRGARLLWRRTTDKTFDDARALPLPIRGSAEQDIALNTAAHPLWNGVIEQLRLAFDFDIPTTTVVMDRVHLRWDGRWLFDVDGDPEQWFPQTMRQRRPLHVADGCLRLESTGTFPALDSPWGLALPTNEYPIVEVRARTTFGSRMIAHVLCEATTEWSIAMSRTAFVTPERWQALRFDFRDLPGYRGKVFALRLVYSDAPYDTVDIDWIRFAHRDAPVVAGSDPAPSIWPTSVKVGCATSTMPVVVHQLTQSATGESFWPVVSGDGTWVAFCSSADLAGRNADGNLEVFMLHVPSGTVEQLTHTRGTACRWPALTSDGRYIFVYSDAPLAGNESESVSLYRYDRSTKVWEHAVAPVSAQPWPQAPPAVADDGSTLVVVEYASDTSASLVLYEHQARQVIYQARDGFGFGSVAISGNGRRVAFTAGIHPETGAVGQRCAEVYLLDRDTGQLRQFGGPRRNDPIGIGGCRLDTEGRRLVFAAARWLDPTFRNDDRGHSDHMPSEIYSCEVPSGTPSQRFDTFSGRFSDRPALAGNGKALVFVSSEDLRPGHNPEWLPQLFLERNGRLEQLTACTRSTDLMRSIPQTSHTGAVTVFHSAADWTAGNNPERNTEIFLLVVSSSSVASLRLAAGL